MSRRRWISDQLIAVVLVALTVYLAHYLLAQGFGLYEDDYWAVAPFLERHPADLWTLGIQCFERWPQGRPLNHFLAPMLAVFGAQLPFQGLSGLYMLAGAWLTLNATLVFVIVRRLLSPGAALVAAIAYVVYPAYSARILLVHSGHIQGAMTFLLLGTWLWLRGRLARVASYPVAAVALLAYETAFIPFLAAPLLAPAGRGHRARAWILHGIACVASAGTLAALRLSMHEGRALEAAARPAEMLWRSFSSLGIGPWTSGGMLLGSIWKGWRAADLGGVVSATVFAVLLSAGLVVMARRSAREDAGSADESEPGAGVGDGGSLSWTSALIAGLVVWMGSYALTLVNYPPTQTTGRLTSAHMAGAWGVALGLAALVQGTRRRLPGVSSAVVVAVLASWLLYQHGNQHQFMAAWSAQRSFWGQVLSLVPEAGEGWTVIVEGTPAAGQDGILANSWADILAYRALVEEHDGRGGPVAFECGEVDRSSISFAHLGRVGEYLRFREQRGGIEWNPEFWRGPFVSIDPNRLALLHDESGVLTRVESITTKDVTLRALAPIPQPGPERPHPGSVGRLMFRR